jgi:cysteine desulfurase / selenocysteine lyase
VRFRSERYAMTRRELARVAVAAMFAPGENAAPSRPARPRSRREARGWRKDFPALAQRVNGEPLVYLDSAATTHRPEPVLRALTEFYRHDNANPSAGLHVLARRAHERYEAARATVATFINAASVDEIVWVRGTTEGNNLVATAWARSALRQGDEILLSLAEHASNLLPWCLVARQTGAIVRFIDVDEAGRIDLNDLDTKLSVRTRLVAFSHVSNVAGFVNPAAEICARVRRAGARVLIDAAQSAPHVPIDVQALGCDFLTFSSHKMMGPMGVGVLWARREILEQMPPYQAGSNMAHDIDVESFHLEHVARKFGAGTPNVSGAIGLAAAINYLGELSHEAVARHEQQITAYALARLREVPGLRLLGPAEQSQRVPVFSFTLKDQTPQAIMQSLDVRGIAIRAGDLAALPLLKRLGTTAAARASCYLYTQTEDIDALVQSLHMLRKRSTTISHSS